MSEVKKILRHYGISKAESNKPDWIKIRQRLNLPISNKYQNLNTNSNKNSVVWKDFVSEIKRNAIKKYTDDTTIVKVKFKFNYVAKLKNGEVRNRVYRGDISGSRENIQKRLRNEISDIIEGLRESDVDIDDDVIAEIMSEEEVPIELATPQTSTTGIMMMALILIEKLELVVLIYYITCMPQA